MIAIVEVCILYANSKLIHRLLVYRAVGCSGFEVMKLDKVNKPFQLRMQGCYKLSIKNKEKQQNRKKHGRRRSV